MHDEESRYAEGMRVPPADKLIRLAKLLGTTTDYLLAGSVSEGQPRNNVRLPERFRALSQCEAEDQKTVNRLIDAVIVKHRVEAILKPVT